MLMPVTLQFHSCKGYISLLNMEQQHMGITRTMQMQALSSQSSTTLQMYHHTIIMNSVL